jgi:hypothetical protein
LANVIARNAGDKVAINRALTLENKDRAPRSGQHYIAFIQLRGAQR